MEESLTYLKEQFELPDVDVRSYSPLVLAYIGDGIYELVIRTAVVGQGNRQANALHKKTSTYVKASAQAAMMEAILEDLTEEELAVYKRGRNAKTVSMAKHATMHDYRHATGFEALMGYLYLKEDTKRIIELIKTGLDMAESQKKKGQEQA